ncbi:MAG TPA: redoxin domain-containing protein [Vicinamibacterales bacterium]|nr:redoxin domain-containing protein [Vicinamibacterales bacterium]
MKKLFALSWIAFALLVFFGSMPASAIKVGEPAPAFTATDHAGKTHTLADLKGKFVVLEWHNQGCPYVGKHYESGNMQKLQQEWTAKGVVWFTVVSSAPGQQGHVTPAQSQEYVRAQKAAPTAVLLDASGEIGRKYDARTSPQMIVINREGIVVYNGAIDDKPTTDTADVAGATNYVSAALSDAMANRPVATPTTQPYGCAVKYQR